MMMVNIWQQFPATPQKKTSFSRMIHCVLEFEVIEFPRKGSEVRRLQNLGGGLKGSKSQETGNLGNSPFTLPLPFTKAFQLLDQEEEETSP